MPEQLEVGYWPVRFANEYWPVRFANDESASRIRYFTGNGWSMHADAARRYPPEFFVPTGPRLLERSEVEGAVAKVREELHHLRLDDRASVWKLLDALCHASVEIEPHEWYALPGDWFAFTLTAKGILRRVVCVRLDDASIQVGNRNVQDFTRRATASEVEQLKQIVPLGD